VNEKPTVLVVEDEAADVFMMQRAVRKINAPISLQVVVNGEEATDYLQGEGRFGDRNVYPLPRLILLDIKMPRKNGFEVLEWLKGEASLRDIPVVMVTSSTVTSDVDHAYGLGARAYLVKPVEMDVLRELFTSTDDFLQHQHLAVQG
jgi:CheY-like chemotaxis protein